MSVGLATASCSAEEWEEGVTLQKHRVTSNQRNQAVKMMNLSLLSSIDLTVLYNL